MSGSKVSATDKAIKYFEDVLSGEITACKKIKRIAEIMLPRIKGDSIVEGYHYDPSKSEKVVFFIENFCYKPSGELFSPLILEPFQIAFLCCLFGFVDSDGYRQHKEALLIIGRKNGKTSLAAAIELYMTVGDGEGAPQVYNVATKLDQATLGYKAVKQMIKQSPLLPKKIKPRTGEMYCSMNMGYIKPLTSRTDGLDGLDVHLGVIDELSAIKDRDLFDLIKQGTGARNQPIILEITTNGFVRNGIFDAQYDYARRWLDGDFTDNTFLPFIYELDEREEWENENCWIKANPGLGTIKKWEYLRDSVNKAKNDSAYLPTVLTKDFNIPENSAVAWLTFQESVNPTTFYVAKNDFMAHGFRYGIYGFDASETTDLTSAQILMMKPDDSTIYEKSMYWIPEDVIKYDSVTGNRRERDDVPFQAWISRGLLRTCDGNRVDKRVILDWMIEMRDEWDVYPFALGYDPWHLTEDATRESFEKMVGKNRAIMVRQGPLTLSQPMKQIKKSEYATHNIVDNNNPINQWCRMNVEVITDTNNNIKPQKKLENPKNRIDGWVAEICAYSVLCKFKEEYIQVI